MLRIRTDLSWLQVARSPTDEAHEKTPTSKLFRMISYSTKYASVLTNYAFNSPLDRREYGYWTVDSNKNIREFFNDFAARNNLGDPLVPETWYSVSFNDIAQEKGGKTALLHYNSSVIKALMDIYPDIGLDPYKFAVVYSMWSFSPQQANFMQMDIGTI